MNVMLNFTVLVASLIAIGFLWNFIAEKGREQKRARFYSTMFTVWGCICYAVQYFGNLGL